MTLILSCIAKDYIVQVSDRRLSLVTRVGGRLNVKPIEDKSNKAVVFCGALSFAYTGLANLQGKKTDVWLLDVL